MVARSRFPVLLCGPLVVVAACAGSSADTDTTGLCADRDAIVEALSSSADPDADAVVQLRSAARTLRSASVPDDLADDAGLLASYLDAVVAVTTADLDDPDAVTDADDRLAALEAQLPEAAAAADRLADALDDC